jgi:hypothetical protein
MVTKYMSSSVKEQIRMAASVNGDNGCAGALASPARDLLRLPS